MKGIRLSDLLKEALESRTMRLNEVSMEQLRSQFVDTGKISEEDFQEIEDASNGKSAYATWLITRVLGTKKVPQLIKQEDVYKYKEYLDIFTRNKRDYAIKDINQIKTKQQLDDWLSQTLEIKDREGEDISTAKGINKSDKFAEFKIGEVDGFDVYKIPKGRTDLYGMSCELGSGTEWCTATGNTRNHFDTYIKQDDMYIFVKGKEKYQFHYASNQFMDKNDSPII